MRIAFALFVIVALAAHAAAHDAEPGKVASLDEDHLDALLAQDKKVLVKFFAPWCGHCKQLAPIYEKLAADEEIIKSGVVIAEVDCTVQEKLGQRFGIGGYPTLKLLQGSKVVDYEGARNIEGFKSFLKKVDQPAVSALKSAEEVKEFAAKNAPAFIALFTSETPDLEALTIAAESEKFGEVSYASFTGSKDDVDAIAKNFGVEAGANPTGIFVNAAGEGKMYVEKWESSEILKFCKLAKIAVFGRMSRETYQDYVAARVPVACVLLDDNAEELTKLLTTVAAKNRKDLLFTYMTLRDGIQQYFNLPSKAPAIAINLLGEDVHYRFAGEYTEEALQAWIDDFVAGKLSVSIKSEPIPTEQNDPIYTAVGLTIDSIINDPERVVLMEFYATWCGHCKQLEPTYRKVAEHFKPNDKVRIARINVPENSVPKNLGVRGFPTIIKFENGKHTTFDGERNFDALVKFVDPSYAPAEEKTEEKSEL